MVRPGQPDIEGIIQAPKLHGATVDGPTERDGELVYHINEHSLTEREIRFLADSGRLTTWEIYNAPHPRGLVLICLSDGAPKREAVWSGVLGYC
jgi:hypothetical protein